MQSLSKIELIKTANQELKNYPGYIEGMEIKNAKMEKNLLIMDGEFFFENNSPTAKTTKALEVYEIFAKEFSQKYTLN